MWESKAYMLLALIHLLRDERLAGFAQDPFLGAGTCVEIELDFGAGRQEVGEVGEVVV